jgi:RNA polymerase sigma factor (sigma-70 family)
MPHADGESRTDEALLAATSRGDGAAFGALYGRYAEDVLAYFYSRTRCPHTAADLTAETFAEVLAGARRYNARRPFQPWLYAIARNLHRAWLRRGRVATRYRERLGIQTPELTHADIERIEQLVDSAPVRAALTEALGDLTPTLRDAVMLRVADELPYEEVASRLGCSVETARARVSRGLAKLESALVGA